VSGVALLIASALAGWLWDAYGPRFTFCAGAAFTVIALMGLMTRGRNIGRLER
jgi:predicted MFS family arabinose efflux permease